VPTQCAREPVCEFGRERVLFVKVVAEGVEMGYVGRFEPRVSCCDGAIYVLVVLVVLVLMVELLLLMVPVMMLEWW
jgi:hypothetical protein